MDGSWGRAMYIEQLYLWHPTTRNLTDFTTNFSFVINSQNNYTYADGLTFFLNGTQLPSDGSGEGLGLAKDNVTNSTAISFIAVEFDTHNNPEKGDPADNSTTSQSLYYNVDLRDYLPDFVTIGFSGSTGLFFQINSIYSWSFSSTLQLPNSVESGEERRQDF
ncbi:hypothetical protein AAG906_026105 [Vitis piasezkii]